MPPTRRESQRSLVACNQGLSKKAMIPCFPQYKNANLLVASSHGRVALWSITGEIKRRVAPIFLH